MNREKTSCADAFRGGEICSCDGKKTEQRTSLRVPILSLRMNLIAGDASRTLRQISRELDGDLTPGREEFRSVLHREEELCDR